MPDETVSSRARKAGLTPGAVKARLRMGWTPEKAFSTPIGSVESVCWSLNPKSRKRHIYDLERRRLASTLLGQRVTTDEAAKLMQDLKAAGVIPTPPKKPKGYNYHPRVANPKTGPYCTTSLNARARKAGIPQQTVWYRVVKKGWSEERALSTPVRGWSPGRPKRT